MAKVFGYVPLESTSQAPGVSLAATQQLVEPSSSSRGYLPYYQGSVSQLSSLPAPSHSTTSATASASMIGMATAVNPDGSMLIPAPLLKP